MDSDRFLIQCIEIIFISKIFQQITFNAQRFLSVVPAVERQLKLVPNSFYTWDQSPLHSSYSHQVEHTP